MLRARSFGFTRIWSVMKKQLDDDICQSHLRRAQYYQSEGLSDKALAELDLAVSADPAQVEARLSRAECYRHCGKWDCAETDLAAAMRLAPDNPEPCVLMAQVLAARSKSGPALRFLDQAQKIDAAWYRVWLIRGDVLLDHGDTDGALAAYQRAHLLEPQSTEASAALAYLLIDKGRLVEADAIARGLAAASPNNPDARLLLALLLIRQNKQHKAVSELNRAVYIAPDHLRARIERGALHLQFDQFEEAFADFQTAVRLNPSNKRAQAGLAESAWRCGRVREAIEAYDAVIAAGDADMETYVGRSEALAAVGRRAEAVADCNQALAMAPANPDVYTARGLLNMHLGRMEDAMHDLSTAITLDGNLVEAIIARGELRSRLGDAKGATADFAVAVRLNQDDPELVARWIRSIGDSGDPITGLHLLDRELRRSADRPAMLLLLRADLLDSAGKTTQAHDAYETAARLYPADVEPHLRFAEFYEKHDLPERALDELDLALSIDPTDAHTHLLRSGLLDRMGRIAEAERARQLSSSCRRRR